MIVVKLMGGMGNQMFQYAFGKSLAIKNNTTLKFDTSFLLDRSPRENFIFREYDLDLFKLDVEIISQEGLNNFIKQKSLGKRLFSKLNASNTHFIKEKAFNFDISNAVNRKNCYVTGYWQTEKYFQEIKGIIRNDFSLKNGLSEIENELNSQICNSNSVCINFRRTDYVNLKNAAETHGVTEFSYYEKAIEAITSKIENPHFFIFSDDIEWCENNFKTKFPTTFVGHEYKGERFSSYLQLMINCKHFIIPNSTFAWWAAWLGKDENKIVIAPEKWFQNEDLQKQSMDIFPSSWIILKD